MEELRKLEDGEDPEHRLAMVVFKEDGASEVNKLTLNFENFQSC